jgi:hypothetical protein
VITTLWAGKRALVVGLAAGMVAAGSAAAAVPMLSLHVHARLAPVAGTKAAGRFDGGLVMTGGSKLPLANGAVPSDGGEWRLMWTLKLPALHRPMTASLRIRAENGAAPVTRVLCKQCATRAQGAITVTRSQAFRIAGAHAVVVVRAPSAKLRGTVRGFAPVPVDRQG